MTHSSLLVAFHMSASADPSKLLAMELATRQAAPDAAVLFTTHDLIETSRRPVATRERYAMSIHGSDPDDALQTLKKLHRKTAIVTLCPDMVAAAGKADISVVTIGIPEAVAKRHYVAAGAQFIGHMLRQVSLEKG